MSTSTQPPRSRKKKSAEQPKPKPDTEQQPPQAETETVESPDATTESTSEAPPQEPPATETPQPPTAAKTSPPPASDGEEDLSFALGLLSDDEMIELTQYGYMPMRADVMVPPSSREAVKRLSLTLDAREARLQDGTLVKTSIPKAIMWLIEQFSVSISKNRNSG